MIFRFVNKVDIMCMYVSSCVVGLVSKAEI